MSAHTTLAFKEFEHILEMALNAHINDTIIISWMIMEPRAGEIGYAASISWPMNAPQSIQDSLGEACASANVYLQASGYVIPEDIEQRLSGQALQIEPKSAHAFLEAKQCWEQKRTSS